MMDKNKFNIVDYIPVGHDNAISRKELCRLTGLNDRKIREEIAKARESACICNMSDGAGYYIPEQLAEITDYINQESARARSIFKALKGARIAKNMMQQERSEGLSIR